MTPLLVATNNRGKQEELRRLLADVPARLVGPADIGLALVPDEPHETYAENARAKADAFCRASGLLTLADDAGLEVAALGWGPGVHTARYGLDGERPGPAATVTRNPVAVLLERLHGIDDRRARMVCCLALGIPGAEAPRIELFEGTMEGRIAQSPRGEGGFGYDPVFELPEGKTTAELPPTEKDRRSHRGRAIQFALPRLRELLTAG